LYAIVPWAINVLIASLLRAIKATLFPGTQVAVHPPCPILETPLLVLQTRRFLRGQLPGSLSLVDSLLLALLTPVYPATWRGSRVPLGCLGTRLIVGLGLIIGLALLVIGLALLVIRLALLGIASAGPGIIGVWLAPAVGREAPKGRR
jgi:hypothetical protein